MGPRGFPARHIGNPKLRDARLRRGWTADDVALALHRLAAELGETEPGVDSNHVSKWERGTRNPGRFYKPRLCLVFEAMPQEIGLAPNPRLLHDIGVLGRKRVERERSRLIASEGKVDAAVRPAIGVLHAPVPEPPEAAFPHMDRERLALTLQHLWPVDGAILDGLERAEREFAYRSETEPARTQLPDLRSHLGTVQQLMVRSQPPTFGARLKEVTSRVAQHAAFVSMVAERSADAFTYYAVGEALAREAGSGTQLAMILIDRSENYCGSSDPARAIALADAAEMAVASGAPAGLRAWIHGWRATQKAELGDDVASGRDIERAYNIIDGGASAEHNLFSGLDSSWADQYRGLRALRLGLSNEAVEVYAGVLRTTDPRLLWERARALSQLASAWLLKGEVERACGLLEQAVELATMTGDRPGLALALRVRERQLGKWRNDPHVRRLDEVLRAARRQG